MEIPGMLPPDTPEHKIKVKKLCFETGQRDNLAGAPFNLRIYIEDEYQEIWEQGWKSKENS